MTTKTSELSPAQLCVRVIDDMYRLAWIFDDARRPQAMEIMLEAIQLIEQPGHASVSLERSIVCEAVVISHEPRPAARRRIKRNR